MWLRKNGRNFKFLSSSTNKSLSNPYLVISQCINLFRKKNKERKGRTMKGVAFTEQTKTPTKTLLFNWRVNLKLLLYWLLYPRHKLREEHGPTLKNCPSLFYDRENSTSQQLQSLLPLALHLQIPFASYDFFEGSCLFVFVFFPPLHLNWMTRGIWNNIIELP